MQQFRQHFSYLSDDLWLRYTQLFQRMEAASKTILLHEGAIANKVFFIEKGCLRLWFNNNGTDTTFQFFFEGQGLASIESFIKNQPSFFTIEAIEPCVLYWMHKKDYLAITAEMEAYPQYNRSILHFITERQFHYMKRFLSFIKDKPAQRYLNLIAEQPGVVQRVPQRYIASYLGITPVSLSRIRGKLSQGKK